MAASSSSSSHSQKCDVFISFRGEDVRRGFLSHLRRELDRGGLINTFNDNEMETGYQIGSELESAIKEARIFIVIFSENYASSKWCLDELAEIHKCCKEPNQTVIPVFYKVDPSEVRKQKGKFGKVFENTCKDRSEDQEQRWKQALKDVANIIGKHLNNWSDEASLVKKIAIDVFYKLLPLSDDFGDFVGVEDRIKAMQSILCLESKKEVRMIGIWGQSGVGKSTLGRALFTHLSPKFPFHAFLEYESTDKKDFSKKLCWEKQLLKEIFGENIEENRLGMVKAKLKDKEVLIILDDVDSPEFLQTLVGKTDWFGPGSRIIVITQDKHLLEAHEIYYLYEMEIPDDDLALKMLCQSAFGEDSPREGFKELAVVVTRVVGNLPLGLQVLGSSLKGREREEWIDFLHDLQNGFNEDIMKPLRASYDRLEEKYKKIFLYIACLFNGKSVNFISDFFGDMFGIKRLAEKSLIRITQRKNTYLFWGEKIDDKCVEVHDLLRILGREIYLAESKGKLGKRRFLTDAKDIEHVYNNQSGTERVLGIYYYKPPAFDSYIPIDDKFFQGMYNLEFLRIYSQHSLEFLRFYGQYSLDTPTSLVSLPPKLKYIEWDDCPLKCLPYKFEAEFLVELRMKGSDLEKLWEGTPQLGSLKTIMMQSSRYLKEIPDLSKAINLERVDFSMCYSLESFPNPLIWKSLKYLNLYGCNSLENFPQIKMESLQRGIEIHVYDCLWNKNLPGLYYLNLLKRCYPSKFLPEHIVSLKVKGTTLKKLWEGVQLLGSLERMDLSRSKNLKKIPVLSTATNLGYLNLSYCKSLVRLPSTIGNLQKLVKLKMKNCTGLKVLPVDLNLSSLKILNLKGCSSLKSFPQVSHSIEYLYLDGTAIEVVPNCIQMFWRLTILSMRCCNKLENISANIFRLTDLKKVDFADCGDCVVTTLNDETTENRNEDEDEDDEDEDEDEDEDDEYEYMGWDQYRDEDEDDADVYMDKDPYRDEDESTSDYNSWSFNFWNCLKLNGDGRELIIQSSLKSTVIVPGGEVPAYFNHQADINFLLPVTLPSSSLSHQFLRFNVCVLVESLSCLGESLHLQFRFDDIPYMHTICVDDVHVSQSRKTDHLVLFSFKFQPICLPSKLDSNNVEFNFKDSKGMKNFGIRLLNVSTSQDDGDGRSSETESNNQSGEKCDIVETERSKKRMRMTSSIASNLWIDSMITEQQDSQLPVMGWGSHLFPSFSNEDVPWEFLSHLLTACHSCTDNKIDVSRPAIKEARLSVVIFSKNYASSTWYLNELVEIHKCHKESALMVIPIFYYVDPCEVRNQAGEFGESFMKTCEDKSKAEIQSWKQALTDLANLHGEHVYNGSNEGSSAEMIAKDVSSKLRSLWFDSIKSS